MYILGSFQSVCLASEIFTQTQENALQEYSLRLKPYAPIILMFFIWRPFLEYLVLFYSVRNTILGTKKNFVTLVASKTYTNTQQIPLIFTGSYYPLFKFPPFILLNC